MRQMHVHMISSQKGVSRLFQELNMMVYSIICTLAVLGKANNPVCQKSNEILAALSRNTSKSLCYNLPNLSECI